MKALNILGVALFCAGALAIAGFGAYEIFKDLTVPTFVKWGIAALLIGAIIILASLVKERVKEKNL